MSAADYAKLMEELAEERRLRKEERRLRKEAEERAQTAEERAETAKQRAEKSEIVFGPLVDVRELLQQKILMNVPQVSEVSGGKFGDTTRTAAFTKSKTPKFAPIASRHRTNDYGGFNVHAWQYGEFREHLYSCGELFGDATLAPPAPDASAAEKIRHRIKLHMST